MAGMNIGYARVSTEEQNLDMQVQALEAGGCAAVYRDDGVSGAGTTRASIRARGGDGG